MKKLKGVRDLIDDLRLIAEQCGAPKDSDATSVGKFIWEKGGAPDIALAARTCGRLQERVESEGLNPVIYVEGDTLHDWIWCVNPMRPE